MVKVKWCARHECIYLDACAVCAVEKEVANV